MKRLYKACLQGRVQENNNSNSNLFLEAGNFIYFLSRPFFAFTFVIVMIFGLRAGLVVVVGSTVQVINERFLYICVIASACIGYSVGNVLDRFESFSSKKIDKLFNEIDS